MTLFSRISTSLIAIAAIAAVGCSNFNENIGNEYMRDDQETVIKYQLFNGSIPSSDGSSTLPLVTFSEYTNTEFNVANLSYGATGSEYKSGFGRRTCGFFSEFTPSEELSSSGFGTSPLISTVVIYLPADQFTGDTTIINKYKVYSVKDDPFQSSDQTVYTNEEAETLFKDADSNSDFVHLFSFNYPDPDNGVYTSTGTIVIEYAYNPDDNTEAWPQAGSYAITQDGLDFMDRLLLKSVDGYDQIKYTTYDFDNHDDFVEEFGGLYIGWVGATDSAGNEITYDGPSDSGASYSHLLSASGFGFSGYQSRDDWDEALQDYEDYNGVTDVDVIYMLYNFDDSYTEYGRNSINYIERTDPVAGDEADVDNKIYVEALGGKVTEMRISKDFFEWFDNVLVVENELEDNTEYVDIYFNKVIIKAYVPYMTGYSLVEDLASITELSDQMNTMPTRLGMYVTYTNTYDDDDVSEMESILDYDIWSEAYYGSTSVFDGYINRTMGYYMMNIQHQMQYMWSEWSELENKDTITDAEWNELEWNRVYIGPTTGNLASIKYATIQGVNNTADVNDAPMQFDLIYTLRK